MNAGLVVGTASLALLLGCTGVQSLRRLAELGDAEAQNDLGGMYARGEGVAEDDAEAVRWYRQAAEQGHAPARYNLALMYVNGEGIETDYSEAHKWLSLAALGGVAEASDFLPALENTMSPEELAKSKRSGGVSAAPETRD